MGADKSTPNKMTDEQTNPTIALSSQITNTNSHVLLGTVLLQILDKSDYPVVCRALLDSGSQSHFISNEIKVKLGLPTMKIKSYVQGINQVRSKISEQCDVTIESLHNGFKANISCLVLDTISDDIPNNLINVSDLKIPAHMRLADPSFNVPNKIDLIIGAQLFWGLLCVGQYSLGRNMPTLQKTKLGWVLTGSIISRQLNTISHCNFTRTHLDEQLEKFWVVENISGFENTSADEQQCEEIFCQTVTRSNTGRFIVTIPLRESVDTLGDSKNIAIKRFHFLERKFASQKSNLKVEYSAFIAEYEKLGHMSVSGTDVQNQLMYYFPHDGVINQNSSTTKLRVVFDGSPKTESGWSFNDIQFVGPNIQDDLTSIISRFRTHKYVVNADIEKMYRQIQVNPSQRGLQQILWRSDPSKPIETFTLNTVTYGTASAPYLAVRCHKQLSIQNQIKYPQASKIIASNFYIDDLLTGADTITEVRKIAAQVSEILQTAGFKLRKWVANHPDILKSHNLIDNTDVVQFGDRDSTKTLGLYWSSTQDVFMFKIQDSLDGQSATKRKILSDISQILDPLGLLSPCIITAKILIQKLWSCKLSWDESVPLDIFTHWKSFREQLLLLNNIKIERLVICPFSTMIELHGFCDASQEAYGACVYIRSVNSCGEIKISLLCSKTRVAPLKPLTIPRLELCSALILAKLVEKVTSTINIHFHASYLWSDSTIALSWIKTPPSGLQVFVGNRVEKIQSCTTAEQWHHVRTGDNSADLLSRGVRPIKLITNSLWWHGPSWLQGPSERWPIVEQIPVSEIPELKKQVTSLITTQKEFSFLFYRFSDLVKLKRVIAYCIWFAKNCKAPKTERACGELTVTELKHALATLVKRSQYESFETEIKELNAGKLVSSKSRLHALNPFLDPECLIRVGGRLQRSLFSYEKKHPLVLCSKHPFTKLLLINEHKKLHHAGPQHVIASIRDEFCPIAVRNLAKRITHDCKTCYRCEPRPIQAIMGALPPPRVVPATPFTNTGVDYAGLFQIKNKLGRGYKLVKCYVCLFICMGTKAIHLELVTELTTEAFLTGLRRFISRRGKPNHLFSDNGTNFIEAYRQLKEFYSFISKENKNITHSLSNEGISWHFIPPQAPYFGGLWEAGVKITKYHLKRVMGNTKLTFEQFYTTLTQIEAILNSRPLTPLSSDPSDLNALTPAHFLIGKRLTALPDPDVTHQPLNRLSQWQHLQQLQQHFWSRWLEEFVSELQQRTRWKRQADALKVGTLIIIKEENLPPLKWQLGRVLEIFPGKDNIPRVASIKTQSGIVKRVIYKICPLPLAEEHSA